MCTCADVNIWQLFCVAICNSQWDPVNSNGKRDNDFCNFACEFSDTFFACYISLPYLTHGPINLTIYLHFQSLLGIPSLSSASSLDVDIHDVHISINSDGRRSESCENGTCTPVVNNNIFNIFNGPSILL